MTQSWLDGNVLAGTLTELFTVELTAASAICDGCGRAARLAEARVYADAPGLVARCPGCEAVLLRVARAQTRVWLDARGIRSLQFDLPG